MPSKPGSEESSKTLRSLGAPRERFRVPVSVVLPEVFLPLLSFQVLCPGHLPSVLWLLLSRDHQGASVLDNSRPLTTTRCPQTPLPGKSNLSVGHPLRTFLWKGPNSPVLLGNSSCWLAQAA